MSRVKPERAGTHRSENLEGLSSRGGQVLASEVVRHPVSINA